MANRPPTGPRFVIPTLARPPPPQPPRPRPPPSATIPPPVPPPFRPPSVVAPLSLTPPLPPSPPPPAPLIPTTGVTTSNSSPKSTVNPDPVAPSSSDKKSSPAATTRGGGIPNAYSTTSPAAKLPSSPHSPVSNPTSHIPTFADHGGSNAEPSPKVKIFIPPPSPLILPPPLLENLEPLPMEAKQKNKTIPENSRHQQHYTIQKGNQELKKDKGVLKKQSKQESGMSIVALAGENRGATMELGKNYKNGLHQKGNSTDWNNGNKSIDSQAMKNGPMDAYINSNVQGVNNSIVYASSYTHNDPGVHLKVLRKRNGGN